MIVVDDPSSPTKAAQESLGSPSAMSTSALPVMNPPPSYHNSTTPLQSGEIVGERKPVEPAGKRFLKAFGVAILVYVLVSLAISSFFAPSHRHFEWGPSPSPDADDGNPVVCNIPWDKYDDRAQESSSIKPIFVPWEKDESPSHPSSKVGAFVFPPYSARTTLELDSEAPLLYFLARGSLSWGKIRILRQEAPWKEGLKPKIRVDIDVRYWSLLARGRANICLLSKDEGAQGVGIYTPQRWPHRFDDVDKLLFTITVTIPASTAKPLALSSFETHLPLFKHEIGDLDGSVTFSSINLKGSNAVVAAQSLQANYLSIQTSNSPISGSFNVTDRIALLTSNGAIDAEVDLRSEDQHSPTELNFRTSNARICTALSLHSTKNSRLLSTGGWFSLHMTTTNGRLNITVPTAPITSHLNIDASSSNGGSSVSLPPTFEGSFSLSTTNGGLNVADEDPEDPTGHGQKRSVELDRVVRGHISGRVWWGDAKDHRELGTVRVRTTNADNILRL